jgi:hypothetical protein
MTMERSGAMLTREEVGKMRAMLREPEWRLDELRDTCIAYMDRVTALQLLVEEKVEQVRLLRAELEEREEMLQEREKAGEPNEDRLG